MDARAVAKAAGVKINTLNVWVARELIPGMAIGTRGLRRDFDIDTAINVALMAELVRFGLGAAAASAAVAKAETERGQGEKLLVLFGFSLAPDMVVYEPAKLAELQEFMRQAPVVRPFNSEADLPAFFEKHHIIADVYAVINVKQIEAKMRRAAEEWEQERQP
jgi:hypothetical protein